MINLDLRKTFGIWVFTLGLFPAMASAQSFQEKPQVPVFKKNGKNFVRVDCFDLSQGARELSSVRLNQSEHPQVYNGEFQAASTAIQIEVSLLDAENTLQLNFENKNGAEVEVATYGVDSSITLGATHVSCSIFMGELPEN